MKNVQKFDFEGMDVRTTIVNDEPLFVAKDVAVTLGYKDTVNAVKRHVDNEDKRVCRIATPSGRQTMTVIYDD